MKINVKNLRLPAMLLSASGLATAGLVQADDQNQSANPFGRAQQILKAASDAQEHPAPAALPLAQSTWSGIVGRATPNANSAIRKAAEAVRDAKSEEAKSAAQKTLTELLSKYYDEDMVQRERELKQIEERLTKLRELLSRRRDKKQDIIDLQIKVALNEAEGLGFYDSERPGKWTANPYSLVPVRVDASVIEPHVAPPNPSAPIGPPIVAEPDAARR